jgi:hypothetical protein
MRMRRAISGVRYSVKRTLFLNCLCTYVHVY